MASEMAVRLFPGDRVVDCAADIGCGTGLYTPMIRSRAKRVVGVAPSARMLAQLPDEADVLPVQASMEDVASNHRVLPNTTFDAILVKESIHHVDSTDRAAVLSDLAGRLQPSGRLMVVMLPTRISYPLFSCCVEIIRGTAARSERRRRSDEGSGLEC